MCRNVWSSALILLFLYVHREIYCICEQGYGFVVSILSQLVVSKVVCFFLSCTDVNPAAAQCAVETSVCNGVSLQPVITDLVRETHTHTDRYTHTNTDLVCNCQV